MRTWGLILRKYVRETLKQSLCFMTSSPTDKINCISLSLVEQLSCFINLEFAVALKMSQDSFIFRAKKRGRSQSGDCWWTLSTKGPQQWPSSQVTCFNKLHGKKIKQSLIITSVGFDNSVATTCLPSQSISYSKSCKENGCWRDQSISHNLWKVMY